MALFCVHCDRCKKSDSVIEESLLNSGQSPRRRQQWRVWRDQFTKSCTNCTQHVSGAIPRHTTTQIASALYALARCCFRGSAKLRDCVCPHFKHAATRYPYDHKHVHVMDEGVLYECDAAYQLVCDYLS